MRIASWLMVACCALAELGVFFPAIEARPELTAHVTRIAHRTSLSLYQAASDRQLARRLLAAYRANRGQRVGLQLVSAMDLHAHGRARDGLDDARDAMDALGSLSDDDAKTIGTAVAVAIWTFSILCGVIALLALAQSVSGRCTRRRAVLELVLAVLVAAMAVAMWIACSQAVFEINDEVTYRVVELGRGAYVMLAGGIGGLLAAIALMIAHIRDSRR